MSISAHLEAKVAELVGAAQLVLLPGPFGETETPRKMYIAPAAYGVRNPFMDEEDGERLAELRALLDAFTLGDEFTVSVRPYRKRRETMLARVDPPSAEVWSLRCTAPDPQIRCFGRFLGKDAFLALFWTDRDLVDWSDEREECIAEWKRFFFPLLPFMGATLDDYLTNYYIYDA